jgi:hypothetical protein
MKRTGAVLGIFALLCSAAPVLVIDHIDEKPTDN